MKKQPIRDTASIAQLQQTIDEPDIGCDLEFDSEEEKIPLTSLQFNLENVLEIEEQV